MGETVVTETATRRWTRRPADRWFAGVAGGLADGLDVEPWIVRLGFVFVTVLGGVGILLYAFLWWLLPRRDLPDSAAQRMAARFPGAPTWLGVGLLVVGVMLLAGQLGWWRPSLVLAFVLIGLGVLLFRDRTAEGSPPSLRDGGDLPSSVTDVLPAEPVMPGDPPAAPSPPQEVRERWFLGLVGGALALGLLAVLRLMDQGDLQDIGGEVALLVLAGILLVVGLIVRGRRREARGRSFLFPLTLGVALLALGVAALLDQMDAISLTVGGGFAIVVLVLGVGLSIGGWYGRGRWLILPAMLLAPMALVATVITVPLDQGFGDRAFAVTSAGQLPATYSIAGGHLRVDLRRLPPGTDPAAITAAIGGGTLEILVPENADVVVTGDVGAGTYSVASLHHRRGYTFTTESRSRGGVDMTIDDEMQGGGGGRPIDLTVHVSIGQLEIVQDQEAS